MSNIISYVDFSNNFMTHIRGFEKAHQDESGTFDYAVGFNIVCKNNNRVEYFESHIMSNSLPSNYTTSNIVDVAWSNILPDVKTWASSVVSSSNILGMSFVPSIASNSNLDFSTTSNFSYNTFSSNFNLVVNRMETYPMNNPSCWCVGFLATKSNDHNTSLALDTQINVTTFALFKAEQEILDLGWSNLKEKYGLWAEKIYNDNLLLNTVYSTSNYW